MTSQYKSPEEIRKQLGNFFEQEYGADILNQSFEEINNLDGNPYRANIVSIIREDGPLLHRMDRIRLAEYISTINDASKALALTEILASIDINKVASYYGSSEDEMLLCKTMIANIKKFGQEAEYIALAQKYMDDFDSKTIQNYVDADNTARQDISDFFENSQDMPNITRAIWNKSSRKVILENKMLYDIGFGHDGYQKVKNIINKHFTELFDKDDLSDAKNMIALAYIYSSYDSKERFFEHENFIKQYPELEKIYIGTQITQYNGCGFNSTPLDKLVLSAVQLGIPEKALNSISNIGCCEDTQEVERILTTLNKLTLVKEPQLRTTFLKNVNQNINSIKSVFHSSSKSIPILHEICAEITELYENGNLDNINYDILLNSKPQKEFKDFEDFAKWTREFSEKAQATESFDFDELSESELKSKAILGKFDEEDLSLNDISLNSDEIRAEALYGALNFLKIGTSPYKNKLWSVEAAKINDSKITKSLIDLIKRKYHFMTGAEAANYDRVNVPEDLLLSWAFNNNQAWEAFEGYLSQNELSPQSVLIALGHTPTIDSKLLPLMKKNLGENFTKTYLEFKEQIDSCPRKELLFSRLARKSNEADFLDSFTEELKIIASEEQFAGNDDWGSLDASLEKDEKGFRQRAEELFLQMLEHREKYITSKPNYHNNAFIRKNFPELVKRYENDFSISKEDVIETISFCHRAKRIKNLICQEVEQDNKKLKDQDPRLIRDIIDCAPRNIAEVEQLITSFHALNERPGTYGSDYNQYYPQDIYPIIKREFPEWMVPVISKACQIGIISDARLGSQKDLFDACKTWKINPYIWKKEAVAIGKMPLPMRMIAGGVFAKIQKEIQPDLRPQRPLKKEYRERFWQEMKIAQEMGYEMAIQTYVKDSQKNRKRVVNLLFGSRLSSHEEEALINNVSLKNLSTLKTGAFHKAVNVLLDLEWKSAGYGDRISDVYRKNITEIESDEANRQALYVKDKDGYNIDLKSFYEEQKNWALPAGVALARVFGKTFPEYIKKTAGYLSPHDAVYWLPKDLSDEKNKSLAEFIHKNIIYADINGQKKSRRTEEMEVIAKNWENLSSTDVLLKFKDVLSICRSKKYKNQKYTNFAEEAAKWGISENKYKKYEQYYEIGLNTPVPVDTRMVFAKDGLVGRFLPRSDARVGFFGNYTGCCQHFYGVGKQCAISSIKDPFSQLFVVENKKGEIIAGSWVWTNKKTFEDEEGNKKQYKTITFDNVEARLSYNKEDETIKQIYQEAGAYLAKKNFRQVTIGSGNSDMNLFDFDSVEAIPLNPLYTGYSDATGKQYLLAENKEAQPIDNTFSELYIAGACQEDYNKLQNIVFECFPEGDRDLQIPDNEPRAMLLKDNGKAVGYIIWTENETATASNGQQVKNWIYDMAVLPEYRTGKVSGSVLLLNEMMKHVKNVGGEWGAELRDKTTLKYMQFMADKVKNGEIAGIPNDFEGRCMIDLEILAQDHTMGDGSKVYEVKFSPLSKEEQKQRLQQREERNKTKPNSSVMLKIKSLLGKMHKEDDKDEVPSTSNLQVFPNAMVSRETSRNS